MMSYAIFLMKLFFFHIHDDHVIWLSLHQILHSHCHECENKRKWKTFTCDCDNDDKIWTEMNLRIENLHTELNISKTNSFGMFLLDFIEYLS